jgi:Fic family protein
LDAQRRSIAQVEFIIVKAKLLSRLRGQINQRQQKALLRLFREGPEGFKGGLSAGNYGTITGSSPATTTRDLAELVENGAFIRTGERKHARYVLNLNRGWSRNKIAGREANANGRLTARPE